MDIKEKIIHGGTALGIELGSTRIKAVLTDLRGKPIASGGYAWENRWENHYWTYSLEEVWAGLQSCYAALTAEVRHRYGAELRTVSAIGVSAMMHGYLALDEAGELLTPFRTWRNDVPAATAAILTERFRLGIPQRWSVAHLYQAILNKEEHLPRLRYLTTLSGYVHWRLTGRKVLGLGDASGMFPMDTQTNNYDRRMLAAFDELAADYPWRLKQILPRVLPAGEQAGVLTPEGAKLLDISGILQPGIPFCPPEGDAATGMVATNSIEPGCVNVSAGTSMFAMISLEKPLSRIYPQIDIDNMPDGRPMAAVAAANGTSDLNAWVGLFREFGGLFGLQTEEETLFSRLFMEALEGEPDCGKLLSYGYLSGEHITGMEEGRPLFLRAPDSRMTLANFMRAHLYAAFGTLALGLRILDKEQLHFRRITGHGGLFKTPGVAQRFLAAALNAPVSVMKTAGEGGAWGIALLAAYMCTRSEGETLNAFLNGKFFAEEQMVTLQPDPRDAAGFAKFLEGFERGLSVERAALDAGIWE